MKVDPTKWLLVGMTPEQTKGAVTALWRVGLILYVAYTCGLLSYVGLAGFVRADEVDDKISAAIEPIKKELESQSQILNALSAQVTQSLAEAKAAEIRHWVRLRCTERDESERNRINRELDRKQEEYRQLKGERYAIRCDEV